MSRAGFSFVIAAGLSLSACDPHPPTGTVPSASSRAAEPVPSASSASVTPMPSATTSAATSPDMPSRTVHTQAFGCDLNVKLAPDRPSIVMGEPVYVSFSVSSTCDKSLSVLDGGDYRNQFGRAETYKMTATGSAGEDIPSRDGGPQMGGMMGPRPLTRTKPFEKRLLVAHWVIFPKPGRYTISVEKKLEVGEGSDMGTPDSRVERLVTVSTSIEVLEASAARLGVVIDELGTKMLGTNETVSAEARVALLQISDERVVPYFVTAIDSKNDSLNFYGVVGLKPFGSDAALAALQKVLSGTDARLRLGAAQTLSENPHPKAWDALWAVRSDADMSIRLTVLHALAKKSPPDVVAKLKTFELDRDPTVKSEATRYLREQAAKPPKHP